MSRATPICSNEDCRNRFKEYGLSYDDITAGEILALVMLLSREIKKSVKSGEMSTDTMYLSDKKAFRYKKNGHLIEGYLFMNSHYFTGRECVSFNKDGFIGFAGWADEGNLNPIRRAFLEWCDLLRKQKEG